MPRALYAGSWAGPGQHTYAPESEDDAALHWHRHPHTSLRKLSNLWIAEAAAVRRASAAASRLSGGDADTLPVGGRAAGAGHQRALLVSAATGTTLGSVIACIIVVGLLAMVGALQG